MSLIDQLEEFKEFIENTNTTIVSNIDMRRKYYSDHPDESKKADLCTESVDTFKNIVVAFIQLNSTNVNQTISSVNEMLSKTSIERSVWSELITRICSSICSSNLTISNTKQNYAKLISIIEKYNAGFLAEFMKIINATDFTVEMLDCLMYIYMNYTDIESELLKYMLKGGKNTFSELLKFINIDSTHFRTLYEKFIPCVTEMTGYMNYVNDEIKAALE